MERIKGFALYLLRHWIMTLVVVVAVAFFLAPVVVRLVGRVPGVGPWLQSRAA